MIEGRCYLTRFEAVVGFTEGPNVGNLVGGDVGAWYRKMS